MGKREPLRSVSVPEGTTSKESICIVLTCVELWHNPGMYLCILGAAGSEDLIDCKTRMSGRRSGMQWKQSH